MLSSELTGTSRSNSPRQPFLVYRKCSQQPVAAALLLLVDCKPSTCMYMDISWCAQAGSDVGNTDAHHRGWRDETIAPNVKQPKTTAGGESYVLCGRCLVESQWSRESCGVVSLHRANLIEQIPVWKPTKIKMNKKSLFGGRKTLD